MQLVQSGSPKDQPPEEQDLYRIGAAAAQTGLAVERLRAWERRYDLAPAHRVGKTRFYSAAQIERLSKIKALLDQGHAISSVVHLTDAALDAKLQRTQARSVVADRPRVGLLGPAVLRAAGQGEVALEVVCEWTNFDAFEDHEATQKLDYVVAELPAISTQSIEFIRLKYPSAKIVLAQRYVSEGQLEELSQLGIQLLQLPLRWHEVEQACGLDSPDIPQSAAPARFSDEELLAMSQRLTDDGSGLASHFVELISQLNAFADYVQQQADQGSDSLADELLERCQRQVTHARARLEDALGDIDAQSKRL